MNEIIQAIAVYALPVIFAITLHEAAHAYVAKYFGDSTAYLQGRMSLNPMKHIDPFGTILLPLILVLVNSPIKIGYAKPVPVDFGKLRKPKRDMAWVALAGPAANFFMAILWAILYALIGRLNLQEPFFIKMATAGQEINLLLFAFNLFPLPPLDGGRVLTSLLPHKYAYKFAQLERYGFLILLPLVYLHVLDFWIIPVGTFAYGLVNLIVNPIILLLS